MRLPAKYDGRLLCRNAVQKAVFTIEHFAATILPRLPENVIE